jgi:hypothetical protein
MGTSDIPCCGTSEQCFVFSGRGESRKYVAKLAQKDVHTASKNGLPPVGSQEPIQVRVMGAWDPRSTGGCLALAFAGSCLEDEGGRHRRAPAIYNLNGNVFYKENVKEYSDFESVALRKAFAYLQEQNCHLTHMQHTQESAVFRVAREFFPDVLVLVEGAIDGINFSLFDSRIDQIPVLPLI